MTTLAPRQRAIGDRGSPEPDHKIDALRRRNDGLGTFEKSRALAALWL
jgi:hypothetical protein